MSAEPAFQHNNQREVTDVPVAFRLGEILVAMNVISREQLEDALNRQKLSQKKRLGEVLFEAGYVQPHQVDHGLRIQKRLLAAALAAGLSLSAAPSAQCSDSHGAHSANANLTVKATVLARASVKILRQTPQVKVTNADVARGYVEVKAASLIEVKNNSQDGFLLLFEFLGDAFRGVYVYGLKNEFQIGAGGGWIHQRYTTKAPVKMELSYRFVLGENALPGTYVWPLSISAQPL